MHETRGISVLRFTVFMAVLIKMIHKVKLCSEIAGKANMAQSKHLYDTHRYNSILCQDETQSPGKRGWRAGTSLRTWVAHSATEACCTPSVWSLWRCGHMSCSHRSWPCRECSVPPARLTLPRCSVDSKHQGSRWCRRQYGNRPGKSWKGNPICKSITMNTYNILTWGHILNLFVPSEYIMRLESILVLTLLRRLGLTQILSRDQRSWRCVYQELGNTMLHTPLSSLRVNGGSSLDVDVHVLHVMLMCLLT